MGREVKRVPVDWDWPLEKKWEGYVNPFYVECPDLDCEGGQTSGGWWLDKIIYIMCMLGDAAAGNKPLHPWLQEFPNAPSRLKPEIKANYRERGGYLPPPSDWEVSRPTPDFEALIRGLTGETEHDAGPFGGYTQRRYEVWKKIVKASGVKDFGSCPTCKGSGIDPEYQERHDGWDSYDPPTGEGWQVWETVSEGSPITPVFATTDELVDYLSTYGTTWDQKPSAFGRAKGPWRREAAEEFVKVGWAPSGMAISGPAGVQFFEGGKDADLIKAAGEGGKS